MNHKTRPHSQPAHQTAEEQRQQYCAERLSVGGIDLQKLSLGHLWLFEEVTHPFVAAKEGESAALSMRDTARAIFILHDGMAAHEALAGGISAFDTAARKLASTIAPQNLAAITAGIVTLFATSQADVTQ